MTFQHKILSLFMALVTGGILAGCVVAPVPGLVYPVVRVQPAPIVPIYEPPRPIMPAPIIEVRPAYPVDGLSYIWVNGSWVWLSGRYVWHQGYWSHRPVPVIVPRYDGYQPRIIGPVPRPVNVDRRGFYELEGRPPVCPGMPIIRPIPGGAIACMNAKQI